jgi:hypothetical protein
LLIFIGGADGAGAFILILVLIFIFIRGGTYAGPVPWSPALDADALFPIYRSTRK